jgi:proteasome alpha subunit
MNFEMLPAAAGYDRAITVFSPDGRLYQVEYAIETVRRGTLAIGIKSKDGIILAVEEKPRKLQNSDITQKIFQVDDHIGVAAAGYIPDARSQVDNARFFSQSNRMIYDEPIEVEAVAKHLADQAQQYTQYAGVRPFGVALAIGAGADQVTEFLEKNYKKDMSVEDAAAMAIESIYLVSEEKDGVKHIKMAQIPSATKQLTRTSEKDIEQFAAKAKDNIAKRPK